MRGRKSHRCMGPGGIAILTVLLMAAASGAAAGQLRPGVHDTRHAVSSEGSYDSRVVPLTREEAAWLREHPVLRLGVDPAWPPYEFIDSAGRYSGIAADYVNLISGRLGIAMEVQPGLSWEQVLAGLQEKTLDLSPAITLTPERTRYLLFTQPYIKYSVAVVTRLDHGSVEGLTSLAGRNVALVKGYSFTELTLASQSDIIPVYVDTVLDGLNKVSNGEAEAIVSDLPALIYKISEYNFLNLKVAGIAPFETEGQRVGVRDDWPILVSILDKALASITPEEHQQIRRRWISLQPMGSFFFDLTREEHEWLANHPVIRNATDPAWAPIEFLDENGRPGGITSEYLRELEQMLHVRFETPREMSWSQMMEALREGRLDMGSCVRNTPQRRSYMHFTEPYISIPTVIFTRTDVNYADLTTLKGQPVAVVEGYAVQEFLAEEYPEIVLVPVRNLEHGLKILSEGKAYAFIDALAPGSYALNRLGLRSIHVAGETPFRYDMSMAASKQEPVLASILQKAIRAIPEAERTRFFEKWATVPMAYRSDYSLIWRILAGAAVLLLVFFYWNRRLSVEVDERGRAEAALRKAKEELEQRVAERTAELEQRNVALAEEVLERKRIEKSLRESEERFFKAFSLSPAPMVISDIDTGRFIDVNEQWLRMFEYTREETIGCTSYEKGIWEDPEVRIRLGKRLKGEAWFRDEPIRFITKSGAVKDALWSAERITLGGTEVMLSFIYDFSERKKAEDALRAKTEELDRFFSVALDLLCIADIDGRFLRLNPQWQAVLGYPISDLEGARFLDLVHPDDLAATLEAVSRLTARESVMDFTNRYRCSDGSYRWIEWRSFPAGNLIYAAARDITERRKAEEALRESEDLLRRSQSVARLGSYYFDVHTGTWISSPAMDELFGIDEHFVRDVQGWIGLVHPEDRQEMLQHLEVHVLKEHNRFKKEYRIIRHDDGEERWVLGLGELELDASGNPVRMIGTLQDITERKRAEDALRDSMRRLQTVVTGAPVVLYSIDRDGVFTLSDGKGLAGLGLEPGEIVGKTIYEVYGDQPEALAALRRAMAGENFVLELSFPEGSTFEASHIPLHDDKGDYAGTIGVLVDISERKRAENELRRSLEEKESLLKEVHHRVKNNLQVISSLLKLQSRKAQSPEFHGFLRDTQNRVRSMALLHETLYRSGNLANVGLPHYVKSICAHVARSYASDGVNVRLRHEVAEVTLDLDRAIPAGLIISELVSNAFKHAFPHSTGGDVLVELKTAPEDMLVLRVSDNGVGFPAELDPESSETLGLLLVRNLTRQLEGRMTISADEGTVFEIVFPTHCK